MNIEDLKKKFEPITIDDRTVYCDGDVLLSEQRLARIAAGDEELLSETQEGRVVRWRHGLTLTYAVVRSSFADAATYDAVVRNMAKACDAWMNTCGVSFAHVAAHDALPDPSSQVVFKVKGHDAGGRFLAAAFFPSDDQAERTVVIDPSYFTDHGFDSVGILRHELGHVLGFRHEHIRNTLAATALGRESLKDTKDLTPYDGKSVMHYVNRQFGNPKLEITDIDAIGAQRLYGFPIKDVRERE